MNCSKARKAIDEATSPTSLPYEAAGHLDGCASCSRFAAERERLRILLSEPARVSAPADFEAAVLGRLAQRATVRRPVWLAASFYLRAGAAAAALASIVLVSQVMRRGPVVHAPPGEAPTANQRTMAGNTNPIDTGGPILPGVTLERPSPGHIPNTGRVRRAAFPPRPVVAEYRDPIAALLEQPRALLLVRGPGSEREIAVPMVSVGAQPWFSVSLQSQGDRGVRTAF